MPSVFFPLVGRVLSRIVARPARRSTLCRAGIAAFALGLATAAPAFADQPIAYTVQAGDTLFAIAQQFSVSPTSIAAANDLANPDTIAIGQTLWINTPSGSATGSSSVASGAHYPAFTIDADGNVIRTLSPFPPPPPPPKILLAPYHSQFDGTIWAESNCGPTTLSMALGALGINTDQLTLRRLANAQMGIADPNDGTTWESLAYAATASGARIRGLYSGQSYRTWTVGDLKNELDQGHPIVLLVRYWDLPDHAGSSFAGDHYIVALGFDSSGNLVYNDPAFRGDGSDRVISQSALVHAWTDTSVGLARTAMAVYR